MNNPEFVKIGETLYPINTDFRVAIQCTRIATDTSISDYERPLAIIYKLFGDKGLNNPHDWDELLKLAIKYLCLGNELEKNDKEPDIDYEKDKQYIRSSFIQDYKYNPYDLDYLHWWDFYNDLNNLSNSEFGNCCVLNRVRNIRNFDTSKIKDQKEKNRILEIKKRVSLSNKNDIEITEEERENQDKFYELLDGGDVNE